MEVFVLRSGLWGLVHNDAEAGRHRLAISISEDEGRSWRFGRALEDDPPGAGGYSYPSALQASDGTIHVTYSAEPKRVPGESIYHARFDEAWLLGG